MEHTLWRIILTSVIGFCALFVGVTVAVQIMQERRASRRAREAVENTHQGNE